MNEERIPFFRGAEYRGSFADCRGLPSSSDEPAVGFTGRSNSGKSSLISALCDHRNLAKTSRTAGKTRTLNYFFVPAEGPRRAFYLADMPGYGYARVSDNERKRLRRLSDEFFLQETNLIFLFIVLDARRKLGSEERNILEHFQENEVGLILARTKWDRLNAREKKEARALWKAEGVQDISYPISSTKKTGLVELLRLIRDRLEET